MARRHDNDDETACRQHASTRVLDESHRGEHMERSRPLGARPTKVGCPFRRICSNFQMTDYADVDSWARRANSRCSASALGIAAVRGVCTNQEDKCSGVARFYLAYGRPYTSVVVHHMCPETGKHVIVISNAE